MSEKPEEEHGREDIHLKEAKYAQRRIGIGAVFWTDGLFLLVGAALIIATIFLSFAEPEGPAEPAAWSFEIWGIKAEGNTLTLGFAVLFLIVGLRLMTRVLKLVVKLYREERDG